MKEPKQPIPVSELDDPDMQAVAKALYRAARRAHLIAHQNGTGVIVMIDGEVVEIEPDPEMYEELDELNAEAVTLAATIKANFEELEI